MLQVRLSEKEKDNSQKCKSKLQDTAPYPLGWLKPKEQIMTVASEDVEKLESLNTADGNVKCCCHFGKQFGICSKS